MVHQNIGLRDHELDTPFLAVDLDILETNIEKSIEFFSGHNVDWRPHTKGQKVPAIAHMEIEAGAIGITCAKLGEAETMVAAGIDNILIANQIVGPHKVRRLANLCRQNQVMVAVDSQVNLEELDRAGCKYGVRIPVLIEVDIGMNRCGVLPGKPTLRLSKKAHELSNIDFKGLMGWEGHVRKITDTEKRKRACEKSIKELVDTAGECRDHGLDVEIISCGGTGTHEFSSGYPGITEVQAGGIIFNDAFYSSLGLDHGMALRVYSTVISTPNRNRIVTDAGKKTMSTDTALPIPQEVNTVETLRFSAEHGVIIANKPHNFEVGQKIQWIVGYGDTTVALHDHMYGIRNGRVELVWPVWARGKIQ